MFVETNLYVAWRFKDKNLRDFSSGFFRKIYEVIMTHPTNRNLKLREDKSSPQKNSDNKTQDQLKQLNLQL